MFGLNLYGGCSHGCLYCYNRRKGWPEGSYETPLVKATLANLTHDLEYLKEIQDRTIVHISFQGDPYDMGRGEDTRGLAQYFGETNESLIRRFLKAFREYEHPFQVLTKGGTKAAADFDLYGPEDLFGVTLTFDNDADSRTWEPGAALPSDRIEAPKKAKEQGIKTWVSMEPVIDPEQTLHLIEMSSDYVDKYWVGKLNYMSSSINWYQFRADAEQLLSELGNKYRIKEALLRSS